MRTAVVVLDTGLSFGEGDGKKDVKDFELRETTAQDQIRAAQAGEKLTLTPTKGYQFIQSPTLVGLELLRRQVVRYGEMNGPIPMADLERLTTSDLGKLQYAAETLDIASLEAVMQRGRG